MSTTNLAGSLLDRAKVAKLGKGIHDNVVITKVDTAERKNKGIPIKKMLYITYATIDPDTKKKKHEVEVAWWTLDPTSEFFFSNLREFCVQLAGILGCYMTDDEVFTAMEKAFDEFEFASVEEMEAYKWKKQEVNNIQETLKTLFAEAIAPFVGTGTPPIRLKLSTDSKGENVAYSSYGVFTEPMTVKETRLKFSESELKNHSKAGNTTVVPRTASAALSL
jgi:hypothetical protein